MKQFLLSALFLLSISITYAAGFQDSTVTKTSVVNALKMNHNSYVTIEGNIIKKIGDDKYMFKDNTGSITVEIDNDKWNDITVNSKDKLELSGEIEKKMYSVVLDVDTVKKVETK